PLKESRFTITVFSRSNKQAEGLQHPGDHARAGAMHSNDDDRGVWCEPVSLHPVHCWLVDLPHYSYGAPMRGLILRRSFSESQRRTVGKKPHNSSNLSTRAER